MQAIMAKTIKVYENISDIYILRAIALLAWKCGAHNDWSIGRDRTKFNVN